MADVARLGLSVDSSEVKKGESALAGLTNAAKKAEAAASGLGGEYANAASRVVAAASAAERAVEAQAAGALAAANANRRLAAAVNDNAAAAKVGSHHAANLAAQFQDVAVTAAMGMNPLQIALQQGTQMAMVFSAMAAEGGKSASTLSLLGAAFSTVLSPAALVIISITALSAGLIQLVPWTKAAQAALNGLAYILPTIAPYAAAAAAGLALLYAPAIIAGVTSVIALIARMTTSLVILAATAAAANPFGAFVLGSAVALAAAAAFQKELAKIFGVDVVASAKGGVNKVIGAFVAAFGDIKFLWGNFPSIMGAAAIGAANAVLSAMETMINAGGTLLNAFIGKVNQALSALPGGAQIGELGKVSFGQIANPTADKAGAAASARALQQQQELNRDYLGAIGGGIAKGASAASAKLKEWAKGLTEVSDKAKKGKTDAEKFSEILEGADRRIASLQAEAAALGLTEEAAARLRYEQDLLNQASQKDITLSAAQRAELAAKAAVMASVEVAAKRVKEAYDFVRDGIKGFISDLRTGLQNGEGFWKSFGNAALNVLNKIISKIEDQLVSALMGAMNAGGGSGGLLGSILGAISGTTSGVSGSGGIGHAATGGRISGPGTGRSDTAGLFALSNGEFVMNAASTKRWLPILEAMNDNRVAKMASGGRIGGASGASRHGSGAKPVSPNINISPVTRSGGSPPAPKVTVNNYAAADGYEARTQSGGINGERMIVSIVRKATARGDMDQAQRLRFGSGPRKNVRG